MLRRSPTTHDFSAAYFDRPQCSDVRGETRARSGIHGRASGYRRVAKVTTGRTTKQKRAIRSAFESEGRPLSTSEAFEAAHAIIDGLGIATVYRSIRSLLDDGWLTPIDVPGKGILYELAGKEHHHHFSCTTCHRVYELDGCEADVVVPLPRGFSVSGHDVTIYGRCAECAAEQRLASGKLKATAKKRPAPKTKAAKR